MSVMLSLVVAGRRIALRSAAALAVIAAGCGDSVNLPGDRTWTGAHFRYHTRADDVTACDSVVATLEDHFTRMNAYLGISWPGGVVDYYKFRDADDFHGNGDCAPSAGACTNGSVIESPLTLDQHELIHVYSRHLGRPPPLFEEGLAEATSPRGKVFVAREEGWRELLAAPAGSDGAPAPIVYWGGEWFVAYLLRRHGPQPFVSFYSSVRADADAAEVAAAFEQTYGVSLDDEWQRARTDAPELTGVPVWECTAGPLVPGGPAADLSGRCDGRGGFATFSLTAETSLGWGDLTLDDGFDLASCALDTELHASEIAIAGARETGALDLPAGAYYVAPVVGGGGLSLASTANAVAAACPDAAPLTLPAYGSWLTLVIGDTAAPRFVKLHHAEKAAFELAREQDDLYTPDVYSASVEVCADCSGSCVPFDNTVETPVSDGQILRLTGLDAPRGATIVRFSYR